VEEWNVYCVYTSDGDDFDKDKTIKYIDELLKRKISMFSYNEINPQSGAQTTGPWGASWGSDNTLIKSIRNKWVFQTTTEEGTEFYKNEELHFLLALIKDKKHVYPTLKHILFQETKK
jgi:uncharacterized sporulation protein YeaH/YhbH (DUF444 family)